MSQFHVATAVCQCDQPFLVTVATSLNLARRPGVRARILAARFHRFRCPRCRAGQQVDTPLLYIDPVGRVLALVEGRGGTAQDRKLAALEYETELAELGGAAQDWSIRRYAMLEDLREHLVAREMGIDHGRLLALLTPGDPRLSRGDRARELRRRTVRQEGGQTYAMRKLADGCWEEVPIRAGLGSIADDAAWAHVEVDSDAPIGTRDTAREEAGRLLAELANAAEPDPRSIAERVRALRYQLPRGSRLTRAERESLKALRSLARRRGWMDIALSIATVFAGLEIDGNVLGAVPADDLDAFCDILLQLPWAEAEANRELQRLDMAPAPGAAAYEWSTGTLFFGKDVLETGEQIRRRLVHEIGHSVHDVHAESIDAWLSEKFGWRMYDVRREGEIDKWVQDAGGWPAGWLEPERARWRHLLRDSVIAPAMQDLPASLLAPESRPTLGPAELDAAKNGFVPALLLARAQGAWYQNPDLWAAHEGRRFALNYYYGGLMVVLESTLEHIGYRAAHAGKRPLPAYAAMSPMEFFAELYVSMRRKVSGADKRPMPGEHLRDQFFLHVWGRHDRAARSKPAVTWNWAMDVLRAAHEDVRSGLVEASRGA
jgi:hypothetical protein